VRPELVTRVLVVAALIGCASKSHPDAGPADADRMLDAADDP
jgi:hypothetical protein